MPATPSDPPTTTEEPLLPRLLASNALRANLSKHMVLNQMADSKVSIIITAASLVVTITLTQYQHLPLAATLLLVTASLLALLFSFFAIIPPLHASGATNLFYFRSFAELSEEEFRQQFLATLSDKNRLYDAYLHEIYFLGKHRLTRKYALIRNAMWCLLAGLGGAAAVVLLCSLP
ncbi:MAG: Pycsar system effector family protein [Desulfuromonas sp.]|jgi:hypothetical protein|nr:DUF5706 domain-containing protein [Desulfuromonas thiophila]MDD3801487.1 DUF5706 domain-containing protein [Desulfuromonas thiophila]MDY0397552.1 DUF5706 domain-containing protein [Desulfuromonas thiophila]